MCFLFYYWRAPSSVLQYYEMSYGLNIEMHKQVCSHIRGIVCI